MTLWTDFLPQHRWFYDEALKCWRCDVCRWVWDGADLTPDWERCLGPRKTMGGLS